MKATDEEKLLKLTAGALASGCPAPQAVAIAQEALSALETERERIDRELVSEARDFWRRRHEQLLAEFDAQRLQLDEAVAKGRALEEQIRRQDVELMALRKSPGGGL